MFLGVFVCFIKSEKGGASSLVGKEVGEDLEGVKRSKKYNQNILYKKMSFNKKKKKAKTKEEKEREGQGREEGTESGRKGGEEEEDRVLLWN